MLNSNPAPRVQQRPGQGAGKILPLHVREEAAERQLRIMQFQPQIQPAMAIARQAHPYPIGIEREPLLPAWRVHACQR